MKTKAELWANHKRIWSACKLCPQAAWTHSKVFYRGDSFLEKPLDVLFVGEAPGRHENAEGKPFVGPGGDILDAVIRHLKKRFIFRWGVTNVVACLPNLDAGDMTPPDKEQVSHCSDRLARFIKIAEPKAFIFLGQSAAKRRKAIARVKPEALFGELHHPAYIARLPGDKDVHNLQYQDVARYRFDELADAGIIKRKPKYEKSR